MGVWGGGSSTTPGKLCNFYPHLRLQIVFPALNMPQNFYIMTIASSTLPYNLPKYESTGKKILISQMFSELGKTWKFFQELWKIKIPAAATLRIPIFLLFVNWEKNLEVPILNILMTWEMLCLNLNFIAEKKMGNLHKADHISTLTWWMTYSISSNFKN